jgi:PKD repeat protein
LPSSITAVMLPPSAGSNPSVPTAGFTVAFGDAGSTNSSGAVTGYSWDFGDATSSSNSATGAFTSHIYAAPGTYQVTLTVTGANSAPGSATTSVVVAGAPAIVPVITFSPAHPTVGQPVTFSSVGSTDSAGTISNYLWQAHDISMTFGPTVTHTFTSAGITTVSLTVFGDHGDSTTNFVLLNVG